MHLLNKLHLRWDDAHGKHGKAKATNETNSRTLHQSVSPAACRLMPFRLAIRHRFDATSLVRSCFAFFSAGIKHRLSVCWILRPL